LVTFDRLLLNLFFFIWCIRLDVRGRCTGGWEEGEKEEAADEKEEKEEKEDENVYRARTWAASKIDSSVVCVCSVCIFIRTCVYIHAYRESQDVGGVEDGFIQA
jgi:hypothetical protein